MPVCANKRKGTHRLSIRPRLAAGIVSDHDGMVVVLHRRGGRTRQLSSLDELPAGALVAEALSVDRSVMCDLKLPFGRSRKSQRVLPSLLDLRLPFPVEACASSFCPHASSAGKDETVLALAAREQDLDDLCNRSDVPGGAHVIDSQALALWDQTIEEVGLQVDDDQPCLVLYATREGVAAVLGRGQRLLGAQWLGRNPTGALGRMLAARLVPAGDLPRGWPCVLAGPGVSRLGEDVISVAESCGARRQLVAEPELFLPRALARRALGTGHYPCNLRTGRWMHDQVQAAVRRLTRTTIVIGTAAGLLLGAAGLGWSQLVMRRQRAFEDRIDALAGQVAGTRVAARGDAMLRQLEASLEAREALSHRLLNGAMPGAEVVVAGISSEAERLSLQLGHVGVGETNLVIECLAPDRAAASTLQGWLTAQGVEDVQVAFAASDAGKTAVTLQGRLP